jgi:translation initiation factor IF-3
LVDEHGKYVGVSNLREALVKAEVANLDLVLINESDNPVICKILNFDHLRYKQKQQKKQQKRGSSLNKIKEVRFHVNINDNDYACKIERIIDFLNKGYKVKICLLLRGRELVIHSNSVHEFIDKIAQRVINFAVPESKITSVGKSVFLVLKPIKAK